MRLEQPWSLDGISSASPEDCLRRAWEHEWAGRRELVAKYLELAKASPLRRLQLAHEIHTQEHARMSTIPSAS